MPLEIVTKVYRKSDLITVLGPVKGLDIPYAPIYMWGYGRVDSSSPVNGLATFNVASCTAVVIHSPDTERTVLTHSPGRMLMDLTFVPIVEWVIGKGEDMYNPKSRIEAVVLRGFDYNDDYQGWIRDFKRMLDHFGTHPNHVIDDKPLEKSSNGMVYVDKESGKVTRVSFPEMETSFKMLKVVNTRMSLPYSMHKQRRDFYVGTFMQGMLILNFQAWPTLFLQYNVNKYMPPIAMPDLARLAIRAKMSQIEIADSLLRDKINYIHMMPYMDATLDSIKISGLPCERCDKPGDKKCLGCLGAWYCSKEHQIEDWQSHKEFCKANNIKQDH